MHPAQFVAIMAFSALAALTFLSGVSTGHSDSSSAKVNWTFLGTPAFTRDFDAWWSNFSQASYTSGFYLNLGWDPGVGRYQLGPPDAVPVESTSKPLHDLPQGSYPSAIPQGSYPSENFVFAFFRRWWDHFNGYFLGVFAVAAAVEGFFLDIIPRD